jgi:hypothetical protein
MATEDEGDEEANNSSGDRQGGDRQHRVGGDRHDGDRPETGGTAKRKEIVGRLGLLVALLSPSV